MALVSAAWARGEETTAFVADVITGMPSVLVIGDVESVIANRLRMLGFIVSEDASVLGADAGTEMFDSIILDGVLHNARELSWVLDRVYALVRPAGRIVIDDIDVSAATEATARWFYLWLNQLGVIENGPADPLATWHAERNRAADRLTIEAAVAKRFAITEVRRTEYLFREISACIPAATNTAEQVAQLREEERTGIARGTLAPVGLKIVARHVPPRPDTCGARLSPEHVCSLLPHHGGLHRCRTRENRWFEWD